MCVSYTHLDVYKRQVFNNYEESESELGALGYKHGDLSEGEDNTIM